MFYVSFVLISHQHGTDNIRNFFNQSDVCGVEDSVENYQTYLIFIFCGYGVRVLWNPIFFYSFCHSYLDLSHDFRAQLCFC